MDVALGKRHVDAVRAKQVPDLQQDLAGNVADAVLHVADPETQLQIERAFIHGDQQRPGFGRAQDARRAAGGLDHQVERLAHVGVERDADAHLDARQIVLVRPVDDPLRDDVFVRDQEFGAVTGFHRDVAGAERRDPAIVVADLDDVPRLDRFVHQQNDAADQIRHDLLQPEADADADRAAEHGNRGHVDADAGQRNDHRQHDQGCLQQLAEQHLDGGRQIGQPVNMALEDARQQHRSPQQHPQR